VRNSSYDEGTFMDAHGRKIFYRVWRARRTKGVIALFHALGLHSGRYTWFCEELASRGFSCYAVDLYGYGLSEGPRGGNLKGVLTSGERFLQLVATKCKSSSLITVGHGSGVLVAQYSANAAGLSPSLLAVEPLHEIVAHLHSIARLKLLSLFNLCVEVLPQPLYDVEHSDSLLEAEEDNLVISCVPAKLVLQLIGLLKNRLTLNDSVTVFGAGWDERSISIIREMYPCGKELCFNPQHDKFPFDEALELLVKRGRPPNRIGDVGGGP